MNFTKKLIVAVAAVALLATFHTQAQGIGSASPSGLYPLSFVTTSTAIAVPANTTTNLPASLQVILGIPAGPWAFYSAVGGTNAEATTNAVVTFELIAKDQTGATQVIDNVTPTAVVSCNGLTRSDWQTNYFPGTDRSFSVSDGIRIKSLQNTNGTTIWFTNLVQKRR